MANEIIPTARALYLCEHHVGYADLSADLYGIFDELDATGFPFVVPQIVAFAQLTGGLGDTPVHIDVRHLGLNRVVHCTGTHRLRFPNRTTLVKLAVTLYGVRFPDPGLYAAELFCHNQLVCDTTVHIHP